MIFTETRLKGAFIIDIEPRRDDRGFFARSFCSREFTENGLSPVVAQCNISFNQKEGTLRGMHYQAPPFNEAKLVRCVRGGIFDVVVDLRTDSPTYMDYIGVELTADNYRALYVPNNFAHGFQTLADNTEVVYQMSEFYAPGYDRGMLYNDPVLKIEWPLPVSSISDKDLAWPLLNS